MGPLIALILVAIVMLPLLQLTGRARSADKLLQRSFEEEVAPVNGAQVPASRLSVLHRWPNNTMRTRYGDLIQVDANWLCRAEDGRYVVAIAQGVREAGDGDLFTWGGAPLQIDWTWRTLSEAQVRNMLTAERKVYRQLFGADP
nr:hypothetical protein [Dyella sp. ASV24]